MVSGGHKDDDRGLDVTNIFDPATESWTPGSAEDGARPLVSDGDDAAPTGAWSPSPAGTAHPNVVLIPEIWEGGRGCELPGASNVEAAVLPASISSIRSNGRVFMAGERMHVPLARRGRRRPRGGRGSWTRPGPAHLWPFNRDYGSAVMYESGKILYVGGGGIPGLGHAGPQGRRADGDRRDDRSDQLGTPPGRSTGSDGTRPPASQRDGPARRPGAGDRRHQRRRLQHVSGAVHAAEIWNPADRRTGPSSPSNAVTEPIIRSPFSCPTAPCCTARAAMRTCPGPARRTRPNETTRSSARPISSRAPARPSPTRPARGDYRHELHVTTPAAGQITHVRWSGWAR